MANAVRRQLSREYSPKVRKNGKVHHDNNKDTFHSPVFIIFALVISSVIISLAYFWFTNPSSIYPERCTLELGLNCKYHRIDFADKSVALTLRNSMKKEIVITSLNITSEYLSRCSALPDRRPMSDRFTGSVGWRIPAQKEDTLIVRCASMKDTDSKFLAHISLKWTTDDSDSIFIHSMRGEIFSKYTYGEPSCCCDLQDTDSENDIWVSRQACKDTFKGSCSPVEFASCNVVQDTCCRKDNVYFWGAFNCSGRPEQVVHDKNCGY